MSNKYFLGSYIVLSIASVFTTIVLIVLKLAKAIAFSWAWVLSPFWGFIVLEFAIILFIFGAFGIKSVFENKKKKRISYNIYG